MQHNTNVYNGPVGEGRVPLEVGKSYINKLGRLVTLKEKRVAPSGWNTWFDFYFIDTDGQRYYPDGSALKGVRSGLKSRDMRRLVDRALAVEIDAEYTIKWPDGGISRYQVLGTGPKGYEIRWSNGGLHFIQYGCPNNYNSVKVS